MKTFYYCITENNTWGRGETPEIARRNARLIVGLNRVHHIMHIMILADFVTEAEKGNIVTCFVCNDFGELVRATNLDPIDEMQIKSNVVGWSQLEYNKPKPKK